MDGLDNRKKKKKTWKTKRSNIHVIGVPGEVKRMRLKKYLKK